MFSAADGLPHCLCDCYPLHHSVACDILLTHINRDKQSVHSSYLLFIIHRRSTHVITIHERCLSVDLAVNSAHLYTKKLADWIFINVLPTCVNANSYSFCYSCSDTEKTGGERVVRSCPTSCINKK